MTEECHEDLNNFIRVLKYVYETCHMGLKFILNFRSLYRGVLSVIPIVIGLDEVIQDLLFMVGKFSQRVPHFMGLTTEKRHHTFFNRGRNRSCVGSHKRSNWNS